MTFVKDNAALDGFNEWTINGVAFSMDKMAADVSFAAGQALPLRMRNASDDVHPIHLHRHSFELTKIAGKSTSGVIRTSSCSAATRRWKSTSSPIIPV